jgi:hypothetical protein
MFLRNFFSGCPGVTLGENSTKPGGGEKILNVILWVRRIAEPAKVLGG